MVIFSYARVPIYAGDVVLSPITDLKKSFTNDSFVLIVSWSINDLIILNKLLSSPIFDILGNVEIRSNSELEPEIDVSILLMLIVPPQVVFADETQISGGYWYGTITLSLPVVS